jgi:hypothetical protein
VSGSDAVVIRTWQPSDNDAVIRIARTLSLPARVRLGIDRSPDFTAFSRAAGQGFDIFVAEVEGRVVGFAETRQFTYRLRGDAVPVAYFALAGIDSASRGLGLFPRLIAAAERRSRETGAAFGLGLVNARNPRVAHDLTGNRTDIILGRRFVVHSLLLGPHFPVAPGLAVGRATENDLPELAGLVNRSYERHLLAPAVDESVLARLGVENTFVARSRGRIVATLGTWDQRALRRILVAGYGRAERILRRLLILTHGLNRLPAPGEELRVVHTVCAAAELNCTAAFAGLLRSVCNRCGEQGHHALLLGLPEDDPLAASTRGLFQFRNIDLPVLIPRDDTTRALLGNGPPSVGFEYAFA